jgi:tRNA G18 (ribose-2'-O)-methylase SpoU
MKQVMGFNFHRGCLALARRPPIATIDSVGAKACAARAQAVGNPDNVSGLFRTAAAFGASGIFVSPSTADPLYRKAIHPRWAPCCSSLVDRRAMAWRSACFARTAGE